MCEIFVFIVQHTVQNAVIPPNVPDFLPGGTFQTTRKVNPSKWGNLAEMKTKKSEFGEAEMAGIFETVPEKRYIYGTYT